MLKDRYTRIVLSVIAVSLAILALNAALNMISSPAQAQRPYNTVITEGPGKDVLMVRDIPVVEMQNIHILGDNKTFIVQKKGGFAVYCVESIERPAK